VFYKCILNNQHKLDISVKMRIMPNSLHQHLISDSGGTKPRNLTTLVHRMLSVKTDVETENSVMGISFPCFHMCHCLNDISLLIH
jgi:hypothetical protein